MKQATFEKVLAKRIACITDVLNSKAKEYAVGGDRLHNFNVAARVGDTTQRAALWGMAMKHLVSIMDIIGADGPASEAVADEKIGDMINYLILLEAVLVEERDNAKS